MERTVGSLFSGIGGLDLGLERAGWTVRWQCESDPYARAVLRKHWPDVPCYPDVRELGDVEPVTLLCGGFPCQDLSTAGRKAGLTGKRSGLWRDFLRIAATTRPAFLLVENIHHAWRRWVPSVRHDLHALGYSSVPLRLSAAELGADHQRTRAFVVAHTDGAVLRDLSWRWQRPCWQVAAVAVDPRWGTATSRMARGDDGISHGMERRRCLGNAVVPHVAEWIGRQLLPALQDLRALEG